MTEEWRPSGPGRRSWSRAAAGFACGGCAGIFPTGAPVLTIVLADVKRIRQRCEKCAGEPVPADLPTNTARPRIELTLFDEDGIERPIPVGKPMTPIRRQAEQFDWRAKASGE